MSGNDFNCVTYCKFCESFVRHNKYNKCCEKDKEYSIYCDECKQYIEHHCNKNETDTDIFCNKKIKECHQKALDKHKDKPCLEKPSKKALCECKNGKNGKDGRDGRDGRNGKHGKNGDKGDAGLKGNKGDRGVQGISGTAGAKGDQGADGATGATGATGAKGDTGATGAKGDTGAAGTSGITAYGYWTRNNATIDDGGDGVITVAATEKMPFPTPSITPLGITGFASGINGVDTYTVTAAGIYEVFFQVPIVQAGKLNIWVGGTELEHTTVGRATGTSQIINNVLLNLAAGNQISVRGPTGLSAGIDTENDVAAIPINPLHSTLVIKKIA